MGVGGWGLPPLYTYALNSCGLYSYGFAPSLEGSTGTRHHLHTRASGTHVRVRTCDPSHERHALWVHRTFYRTFYRTVYRTFYLKPPANDAPSSGMAHRPAVQRRDGGEGGGLVGMRVDICVDVCADTCTDMRSGVGIGVGAGVCAYTLLGIGTGPRIARTHSRLKGPGDRKAGERNGPHGPRLCKKTKRGSFSRCRVTRARCLRTCQCTRCAHVVDL